MTFKSYKKSDQVVLGLSSKLKSSPMENLLLLNHSHMIENFSNEKNKYVSLLTILLL